LHWLISGIHRREWRLTIRTILRRVIIDGAALSAVSAHLKGLRQGLRVCENAKASDYKGKNQVATPEKDSQTKKDETEKFSLLRGIQCARHVAGSYLSVYLSGENDADNPQRKTAKR